MTELYRDQVKLEVERRPGGGAWVRIVSSGQDAWEGSSNVLDLTPEERDWFIGKLLATR